MTNKRSNNDSRRYLLLVLPLVLPLVVSVVFLASTVSSARAESVTVSGSLSSEQINLGLSEANGRPGIGLAIEWEVSRNLFFGASGYQTADAPAPNRPQNLTAYTGLHWGSADALQYDLTLLYRVYPGDFPIDWDYPELRFDVGISPQFGLTLSATNDFYGLHASSVAASAEYLHDFSAKFYSRVEGGYVYFDSSVIDSYGFLMLSAGMRGNRWSIEGGYRANNADAFPAFRNTQIENRFMLSANWLFY